MKWIKISVVVLLSLLISGVFAVHGQKVPADGGAGYAVDPSGSLYLLSRQGELMKLSPEGTLLWQAELPRYSETGNELRYGGLISDDSGSLYLAVQEVERLVDAAGQIQEIILTEEVQTWNGDGVQQDSVLQVDKTTLSQYSTQPYIWKLQMQGETLVALCCDQGRFDVIFAQPYTDGAPQVAASYQLDQLAEEVEDCAALSDGTLVYSTKTGGLYAVSPQGETRDLSALAGRGSMAGQLSADETDTVYFLDRSNGTLYALDLEAYTVVRRYSPDTVLEEETGVTFGQLQGAAAVGYGDFCAVSVDSADPFWVRFGGEDWFRIADVRRGWDAAEAAKAGAVFLGSLLVLGALTWGAGLLFRRSRLTGRIILQCLPALVVVLGLLAGGAFQVVVSQRDQARQDSLAAAARAAASRLDGGRLALDTLRTLDAGQRENLAGALAEAAEFAGEVSGLEGVGLILYTEAEGVCYGVCATLTRDAFRSADYLAPLSLELPAQAAEAVQGCAAQGGDVELTLNGHGYASYVQPILDAAGRTAGLVEARVERQTPLSALLDQGPAFYVCAAGAAGGAALLVWLLAVLMGAFRPLQELNRCIGEISAGNWSVQARITSRDELAQIGISFNQMTEKLSQYISNMVLLNNEYIKFTPRELFQLLGKTKVTDLQLRDQQVQDMSLLYVTFGTPGEQMGNEDYFSLMNENYDRIFDVVDINHGIIQRFDGAGMLALFPGQTRDALNTAISLKEIMAREERPVELKILISRDRTLVGVAGNQKRQTITAISKTIMDIYALNSLMDEIGTRYIITRRGVEGIGEDSYFSCREIGAGDWGRESLYEFLDGMDTYEKKLHLITREEFEKGIHDYQQKRYFEARKHFASVLQTNQRDQVAMYYLMLCDTHSQEGTARQN